MNQGHMHPQMHPPPMQGGPVIPPPPDRRAMPRSKSSGPRVWLWPLALLAGAGLGFALYQLTGLDYVFDYWIALVLG